MDKNCETALLPFDNLRIASEFVNIDYDHMQTIKPLMGQQFFYACGYAGTRVCGYALIADAPLCLSLSSIASHSVPLA